MSARDEQTAPGDVPATNKPYKGADSFEVEDRALFYGREQEARELMARVLSSRLTVLYAASGAGKTSLLNARLIGGLEERRWAAIRVRIDNDPVEAVRFSVLQYLMPPPISERLALRAAANTLEVSDSINLEQLAEAFDALPPSDPRQRTLIAPIRHLPYEPTSTLLIRPFGNVMPMLRRFLGGSIDIETLREHFEAIVRLGGRSVEEVLPGDWAGASLRDIEEALRSDALIQCYDKTVSMLYPPVPGLRAFVENVFATYGVCRTDFCIVLILDQFEEMFTRFVDPGRLSGAAPSGDLPNWTLRSEFFDELEDLYRSALGGADASRPPGDTDAVPRPMLPLRLVISLREEYLGRLEQLRRFAPEINGSTYRLGLLAADTQAREAILQPAREYGYTYDTACLKQIVDTLAREGFVEPFLIQMVCDSLWKRLQVSLPVPGAQSQTVIGLDDLQRVFPEGVQGIVDAYFVDLLDSLGSSDATADALELMELLITGVGTRNIVEERVLLNVPFRSETRRRDVLNKMVHGKFLRRERRLGSFFVEITHECLIASVQKRIAAQASSSRDLREALQALDRIRQGSVPQLGSSDFRTLDTNHGRIEWPRWAVVLMMQSASQHGTPEQFSRWLSRYRDAPSAELLRAVPLSGTEAARYLTLEELRAIAGSDAERLRGHEARMLRSLLVAGRPEDASDIQFWAQRI